MSVRVGVYRNDEFGGYTDMPDSCAIKAVSQHYVSRGYSCRLLRADGSVILTKGEIAIWVHDSGTEFLSGKDLVDLLCRI